MVPSDLIVDDICVNVVCISSRALQDVVVGTLRTANWCSQSTASTESSSFVYMSKRL